MFGIEKVNILFKTIYTIKVWYIMTIICIIWQHKNIFKITITLKVKKNSNISSICNTFCKIENLMQTNAF
jgi:hypothetical protein